MASGAALFVGAFAWFWFWRSNGYTGGDSGQWDRTIFEGWWLQRRQMLSFVTMQATFQVMHALLGWTSRMAIALDSCVSGALAVVLLWRMFRDRGGWGWGLAVAATAGFTLIYYGHIETYAMSVTAMLFHLLAVQRTLEGRWPPWTLAATFTLMLLFHLIAIFMLPAALTIAAIEIRKRPPEARGWGKLLLALSPVTLVWLIGFSGMANFAFDEAVSKEFFVAPPLELIKAPWLVLTHRDHRGDLSIVHKMWFMIWDGGFFAILAPWVFFRFRRERLTLCYLGYFLCFLIWTAVWAPLQYAPDFDLFCFPWVIATLAVARHLADLPGRSVWAGALLGANVLLFLIRPAVFAEVGNRGTAQVTLEDSPHLEEATIFLDESFKIGAGAYRYLPTGVHVVTLRRPQWPMLRRAFVAGEGEALRIRIDERLLEILPDPAAD